MSFASLGTFSNNVESALIPCYDLNIDKYIQKSKEIFDWVEIMEFLLSHQLKSNMNLTS